MPTQIETRAQIYAQNQPYSRDSVSRRRETADHRREMLLAKLAVGMTAVSLLVPQVRESVMNLLHPQTEAQTAATLADIVKHNKSVLSVQPDPAHPGLDKVTYRFRVYHATDSNAAVDVAPNQSQNEAVYNLETYTDGAPVHIGDTISFDVSSQTGDIVPNPNAG